MPQQSADAIAAKYGGTVIQNPDDIAAKYGGSVTQAAKPKQSFWQKIGLVPSSVNDPDAQRKNFANAPDTPEFGQPGDALTYGLQQGTKQAGKFYAQQGPGEMISGAGDVMHGQIAKGGHRMISGAGVTLAPLAPEAIAANPALAGRVLIGSTAGGAIGAGGAKVFGANPDQQQFAGDLGAVAGGGAGALTQKLLPSRAAAGALFNQASAAAGADAIDLTAPGNTALKIRDMAGRGGQMPKVVRDFITRATDPKQGPISYDEARDFYTNAGSKLSTAEAQRLSPNMRRMLGQFTQDLGQAIQQTATNAGVGEQYSQAMSGYRQAMTMDKFIDMLKGAAADKLIKPAAAGAGFGGAYALYRKLTGGM